MDGNKKILEYVKKQILGPKYGENEILSIRPKRIYSTGILFPVSSRVESEDGEDTKLYSDDPVNMTNQLNPSAAGLSFATPSDLIKISVSAGIYEEIDSEEKWERHNLSDEININVNDFENTHRINILSGRAEIYFVKRKVASLNLLTISIVNRIEISGNFPRDDECLFQVYLSIEPENSEIAEYPRSAIKNLSMDEKKLQVQYLNKKNYGIGHGVSADWNINKGKCEKIFTSYVPSFEVRKMDYETDDKDDVFKLVKLSNEDIFHEVTYPNLKKFIGNYESWVERLEPDNKITPELESAVDVIKQDLVTTIERMRKGLSLIQNDEIAREAFHLGNQAMLIQMVHSKLKQGSVSEIDYMQYSDIKWRPFQLGFILLTIESILNEQSTDRDVMDLLWFPTGGGKTEAYLAVSSILIFYRRLKYGEKGAGLNIISRYTLRLLTNQQFIRTGRLVTACEYLRQKEPERLGNEPITVGLWVGDSVVPNRYQSTSYGEGSSEIAEKILKEESPKNKFQVDECPWCGHRIIPEKRSGNRADYGFEFSDESFKLYCPSSKCLFNDYLPIKVVDQSLYESPPTILIGTVDKFARLAWTDETNSFFGANFYKPPSLILQDELHLLSGPLGTIAGLYEAGINTVIEYKDVPAKTLSSTATVRNAHEQIRSIFSRDANIFPSPGLTADDSYFAKVSEKPERLYVGVMSQSETITTSIIRLIASTLQSINEVDDLNDDEINSYYTNIIYHNSLRELGKSITLARDDIPSEISLRTDPNCAERKVDSSVLELTSSLKEDELTESLNRLNSYYKDSKAVSLVASTNMISVGIDINRLGLMTVHGQPKTTAEYIQATSRVGRSDIPGLVFTHYSPTKPRDISHYESFRQYHQSLYKFVEPTSATPYSRPARERALHAALIIIVRHGLGFLKNKSAGEVDFSNLESQKILELFLKKVNYSNVDEYERTKKQLNSLIEEWEYYIKDFGGKVQYQVRRDNRIIQPLMKHYNAKKQRGRPTLNSMRNIDENCHFKIMFEDS